jgi:threonine synthase
MSTLTATIVQSRWQGVIQQYAPYLPVTDTTPVVSLNEGNTPLIAAPNFVEAIGGKFDLYLKFEGLNPTCSFKDRGMTLAVSKAKERGAEVVICASTGNTSASAAARGARNEMRGAVAAWQNHPRQTGAGPCMARRRLPSKETSTKRCASCASWERRRKVEVVNSINPFRIEGPEDRGLRNLRCVGDAPDFHFLPVGNAGNITAYWKGYKNIMPPRRLTRCRACLDFSGGRGADCRWPPRGRTAHHRDGHSHRQSRELAGRKDAIQESSGHIDKVTDEEILAAYKLLARTEGILVEPASAACLAGVKKCAEAGMIPEGSLITATMTGHGLKDPDTAIKTAGAEPSVVPATKEAVMQVMGL